MKNKLDALRSQLGLMTGKDIALKPLSEPKTIPPTDLGIADKDEAEPSSAEGRLLSPAMAAQLRARLGTGPHKPNEPQPVANIKQGLEIEDLLPGCVLGDETEGFFLYKQSFPLDYEIGRVPLRAALTCAGKQVALSACDASLLQFDPRATCFMDTETTGLAGGAGTVAFLVGFGYFEEDSFILEQCFLRDYDDEGPMLAYLEQRLAAFTTVVSYNGKSFDLPLLRSRFVQHRLPFPLSEASHYDLVHAARRVWKKRLADCSLGTIEQEVLGLRRQGDVPGYLIPALWLSYLDLRDARPLKPVFYHHAMDILSLAALAGHLSQRLAIEDGPAFYHAEDQLSVLRLYHKNKDYEAVIEHGRRFLETSRVSDDLRRECLSLLAQACKRSGRFEEMQHAWQTLLDEYPDNAAAAEELAKCLEHQHRNYQAAIDVCRKTLAHLEEAMQQAPAPSDFGASALRGRLARLQNKQDRLRQRLGGNEDLLPNDD